jgi:hypothetical protein
MRYVLKVSEKNQDLIQAAAQEWRLKRSNAINKTS